MMMKAKFQMNNKFIHNLLLENKFRNNKDLAQRKLLVLFRNRKVIALLELEI
jgi:hypothetical protein